MPRQVGQHWLVCYKPRVLCNASGVLFFLGLAVRHLLTARINPAIPMATKMISHVAITV